MQAAARLGDQITHTSALGGLLTGLLIGAVIGVAALAVVTTGGLAAAALPAIIGWACTGASIGAAVGQWLGTKHTSPSGNILSGSHTIFIGKDSKAAARAHADVAHCDQHGDTDAAVQDSALLGKRIASGSSTVIFEGFLAARVDDVGTCSFKIAQGCDTVLIGGETAVTDDIDPEVPWLLEKAVWVIGLVGAGGLMRAAGMSFLAIGTSLLAGEAGSRGAAYYAGKQWGEGSWQQTAASFIGGLVCGGGGAAVGSRLFPTAEQAAMRSAVQAERQAAQAAAERQAKIDFADQWSQGKGRNPVWNRGGGLGGRPALATVGAEGGSGGWLRRVGSGSEAGERAPVMESRATGAGNNSSGGSGGTGDWENAGNVPHPNGTKVPPDQVNSGKFNVDVGQAYPTGQGVRPPTTHNLNVRVLDENGSTVRSWREVSGEMTDSQKTLNQLPGRKGELSSHTEQKALTRADWTGDDTIIMTGQRAPCSNCKGGINQAARETGASIYYQWRENGVTNVWKGGEGLVKKGSQILQPDHWPPFP